MDSANLSNPTASWKTEAIVNNMITLLLCITINFINTTLVYIFFTHEIFRSNPRYVLYIHLVINDMILLTTLILFILLTYIVYLINVSLCIFLIVLAAAADFNNPLTLAFMALECCVAVCYPLRHAQLCTVRRAHMVIALIWLSCAFNQLPDVFSTWAAEPLQFFASRALCVKARIMRLSYIALKDTIVDAALLVIVWLTLIYAYFRILFTAKSASAAARKARNTVLLHSFQLSLSLLSYAYFLILEGFWTLFPRHKRLVRFVLTVLLNIIPRLINPLVYGLRDATFRKHLKQYLSKTLCSQRQHLPVWEKG